MGELGKSLGGNAIADPALLPSQLAIQGLYRELILQMPPEVSQFDRVIENTDPRAVRDSLASTTMGDILVGELERLAPDPRYSDYQGVYPGVDATLSGLSIGAFGVMLPKMRRVSASRRDEFVEQSDLDITDCGDEITVTWPEVQEWCGDISVRFWYDRLPRVEDEETLTVGEVVQIETQHRDPGISPSLQGRIAVPGLYATSSHRHARRENKIRPATEAEVFTFLDLVRGISA